MNVDQSSVSRARFQPFVSSNLHILLPVIVFTSNSKLHDRIVLLERNFVHVDVQATFNGIVEVFNRLHG